MGSKRPRPRPILHELPEAELENAMARLGERTEIEGPRGCWVTRKGLTRGYSQVSIHGWPQLGHAVSYVSERGKVPDGMELDHVDFVSKACWNPWHVEPVTHAENMARHREKKYGARKLPPIWVRQPGYSTERVRESRREQRQQGKVPS